MVKCPECGAEIDYLMYRESISTEYRFIIDNEGFGEYDLITKDIHPNDIYYKCPECGTVLFSNELTATEFLTGEGKK